MLVRNIFNLEQVVCNGSGTSKESHKASGYGPEVLVISSNITALSLDSNPASNFLHSDNKIEFHRFCVRPNLQALLEE